LTTISEEKLRAVEGFFHERCSQIGTTIIDNLTVEEVADKSGVSLATAHKAIRRLEQEGKMIVLKGSSRRENNVYVYKSTDFGNRKILVDQHFIDRLMERIYELETALQRNQENREDLIQ
jgi:predicted transcriptional regulator